MKLQYMGTAACEAIPALFCQCPLCKKARVLGGRDIRGRSGAVLNDVLMVDFPPDVYMHSLHHNVDLSQIRDIVITHTHCDHFVPSELMMRFPGCFCHIHDGEQSVELWGNEATGKAYQQASMIEFAQEKVDFIHAHLLKAFTPSKVGSFVVTPLPALHKLDENAFFYLFEEEGKTLLYANDTGIFYDSVFDYFKEKKVHIDLLSFDCTFGKDPDGGNHMGMPDNDLVRARLLAQGNVDENTKYIVTHFSHNCGQTYDELSAEASKYGFFVAYDGLTIEI